jgi:hypothetical protein
VQVYTFELAKHLDVNDKHQLKEKFEEGHKYTFERAALLLAWPFSISTAQGRVASFPVKETLLS